MSELGLAANRLVDEKPGKLLLRIANDAREAKGAAWIRLSRDLDVAVNADVEEMKHVAAIVIAVSAVTYDCGETCS